MKISTSHRFCGIRWSEITHDEPIILPPEYRTILHSYGENLTCQIACYHIEEIITEKLRALLQTHQKLVTRGWNRPRARDYYDLWFILKRRFKYEVQRTYFSDIKSHN